MGWGEKERSKREKGGGDRGGGKDKKKEVVKGEKKDKKKKKRKMISNFLKDRKLWTLKSVKSRFPALPVGYER